MPTMGNIGALLAILVYLYAILGVNLFAEIKLVEPMNEIMNF